MNSTKSFCNKANEHAVLSNHLVSFCFLWSRASARKYYAVTMLRRSRRDRPTLYTTGLLFSGESPVCVTAIGIFTIAAQIVLVHSDPTEDMFFDQACHHVMEWLNFPLVWLWYMISKLFAWDSTDQMEVLPVFFISLGLWWVFLGSILGTFFYIIQQRFFKRHH